jgi:hypothetical protein
MLNGTEVSNLLVVLTHGNIEWRWGVMGTWPCMVVQWLAINVGIGEVRITWFFYRHRRRIDAICRPIGIILIFGCVLFVVIGVAIWYNKGLDVLIKCAFGQPECEEAFQCKVSRYSFDMDGGAECSESGFLEWYHWKTEGVAWRGRDGPDARCLMHPSYQELYHKVKNQEGENAFLWYTC